MSSGGSKNKKLQYIFGLFLIIYTSITLYNLYKKSASSFTFFTTIWNYKLYESATLNLSVGKIFLLISFLIISFSISKLIINKVIHKALEKTQMDVGAKSAIENLSGYILKFLFVIIALGIADIPLAAFTFIGGAFAIGFGFGTQNILNNFISGIILQIEKPIKVGDHIDVDAMIKGKVIEIGTRSTKILLTNNTFVVVPNSVLLEKPVNNWNYKNQIIKSKIIVNYDHKNDIKKVTTTLDSIISKYKKDNGDLTDFTVLLIDVSNFLSFEVSFLINRETSNKAQIESQMRMDIIESSKENSLFIYKPS